MSTLLGTMLGVIAGQVISGILGGIYEVWRAKRHQRAVEKLIMGHAVKLDELRNGLGQKWGETTLAETMRAPQGRSN